MVHVWLHCLLHPFLGEFWLPRIVALVGDLMRDREQAFGIPADGAISGIRVTFRRLPTAQYRAAREMCIPLLVCRTLSKNRGLRPSYTHS